MKETKDLPTYSTQEAAKQAGIAYVTLRRWVAAGSFQPSIGVPIGRGRHIWRFTTGDIAKLRDYKEKYYCSGRGRVADPLTAIENSRYKASKQFTRTWRHPWDSSKHLEDFREERRQARLARKSLEEQCERLGFRMDRDIVNQLDTEYLNSLTVGLAELTDRMEARAWVGHKLITTIQTNLQHLQDSNPGSGTVKWLENEIERLRRLYPELENEIEMLGLALGKIKCACFVLESSDSRDSG